MRISLMSLKYAYENFNVSAATLIADICELTWQC